MSTTNTQSQKQFCSGWWCAPLWVVGSLGFIDVAAHLAYGQSNIVSRLWNGAWSVLWIALYLLLVFLLCQTCKSVPSYLAIIPASVMFGLRMFSLLVAK